MKLIVGLGNPGTRYQKTRHNVGQRFVDQLSSSNYQLTNVKLHKTNIFMNESGKEVKELINKDAIKDRYSREAGHQLAISNLLVVHDDLDMIPGKWKLQFNRSAAGHKGVQSVIDELGTQEFWRLRIGVGKPPADKTANQFVVEKPTKEELKVINSAIEESIPRVIDWIKLPTASL